MFIKPLVRRCNQGAVKPLFTPAGFVAGNKEDGLSARVEGKGHSPHAVSSVEAQLFHVGVSGILQCVHVRTPELGTERFEQPRLGKQGRLYVTPKG